MGEEFGKKLERLHHDLVQQGQRVEAIVARAFDAIFTGDRSKAEQVIADDDIIDRADVVIERAAVALLVLGDQDIKNLRQVLTIVKVNNELERIADLAADIAEQTVLLTQERGKEELPATMQVLVNSVVGMIRDANKAMRELNSQLARIVLTSDDLVEEFKERLMREVQEQSAAGQCTVDFSWAMWHIAAALERMADHTTNIAEQVIYVDSGQIVRHSATGWSAPMPADQDD